MSSSALNVPMDATLVLDAAPAAAPTPAARAGTAAPETCANCGLGLGGGYCSTCGQRAVRGRLTVPAIANQVASDVLNLDHGILYTALELSRRPGDAIRDYVNGKRVRYTGPVKYFVLTVALTTFATTQLGVMDEIAEGMFHGMNEGALMTPAQASAFMSEWTTPFMALGVPFTAAVTRRLFRGSGMTYAEHLALNLYSYGHQCLGLALVLLIGTAMKPLEPALVMGWTLASVAYFGWTCTRFFGMTARRAVPRALLGIVMGTLAYFSAAAFIVGVGFSVAGL